MTNRVKAFTGPNAKRDAERAGHFCKALMAGHEKSRAWCVEHGIALTKATNESNNIAGGFFVPPEMDAGIINVREAVGAFRQGAEVRPTKSVSQIRPRRIGGLTANFVAEGAPIPESSLQLDAIETAQKKIAILGRASAELFEDSAADLGEFLTSEIGYAFAAKEDDCGFNADGTSVFAGMSGLATKLVGLKSAVAAGTGHNVFTAIDTTDMANLMAGVMAAALQGAAWYTSAIGFAQIFSRIAMQGGAYMETRVVDGIFVTYFLGFPIRFSSKLPDGSSSLIGKPTLFFGDLAMSSILVERQAQTIIAVSRDRAFDSDQVLVRGVQRCDIVNHTVGDAATRGPVAMLVGTA